MVFFIKYEFWPNYLYVLKKQEIPTYLIAGIFRKNQALFRSKRSLLRKALASFDYFFLQNQESIDLLKGIGITDAVVSGDTRFDRVSKQLEIDNKLEFMEKFKGNSMCLVCGSTWPEDESVLLPFLNSEMGQKIKIVIAPHKIDHHLNKELQKKLKGQSMLYSGMDVERLPQTQVLLLDTVGFLSKVYSYADVAYVGGAMGNSGLHNILEPATFGIPIVIGKNFDNFPEAKQLKKRSGLFSIKNAEACQGVLHNLFTHSDLRAKTGTICRLYVKENTGATQMILDYIKQRDLALGVISVD